MATDKGTRARSENPIAVMFADITGSTTMYAERGDTEAYRIVSVGLTVIEQAVRDGGGRVVKRIGDEIMAVFPSAPAALLAAQAMQPALDATVSPDGNRLSVRVGINWGNTIEEDGDAYGDVVNVASRLVGVARPQEICVSEFAFAAMSADQQRTLQLIDSLVLRGRPEPVQVYHYASWAGDATEVTARRGFSTATLHVGFGEQTLRVDVKTPRLDIGRDATNHIVIVDGVVSRHHAEIVLRSNKFMLIDRSTNGTYVFPDTGERLRLNRDEVALVGSGRFFVGAERTPAIHYRLKMLP